MSVVPINQLTGSPSMSRVKSEAVAESSKVIAERIVRLRKERGITQVQLAAVLGVTQPMVSRLERGDFRFNDETLVAIANLYKVSADEILGLKSATQEGATAISRRWLKRLMRIEKLPKRDQDGLIQTVDRYLKASDAL